MDWAELISGALLVLLLLGLGGYYTWRQLRTLRQLRAHGLDAEVAARCHHPFGPVFTARAPMLEDRGLIARGQRTEELIVVRATRGSRHEARWAGARPVRLRSSAITAGSTTCTSPITA